MASLNYTPFEASSHRVDSSSRSQNYWQPLTNCICLPSERRPERSSIRRHKSTTTINASDDEQESGSFQRRWSFRLPHSTPGPSLASWTALKVPDYFKEGAKTEEVDTVKRGDSPKSLKRFVSHSDLSQVSLQPRHGPLHSFLTTPSSSTSSIPTKVKII